ncbi:NAD(P)/FAD-dependent oxidoreductase [Rhodohalobacter sp. 8-1]|uniref:NAD(P)/FAD-dependent oxidoreductase n=1 Tax=Rhodohalobacter sp. 8-1 TaxID=3131972 RepID=UPI0030EF117D
MSQQDPESIDFTILGAGIAGLSVADELLQRNKSVTIIDKARPGSGSSGAPLVLINPATGRRAKKVHRAKESLESISDLLSRVKAFSGQQFYEQNGVLRPALDEDLAKDFHRSPKKYDWPDSSWIQWLDKEEFSSTYNYFGENFGGLVLEPGYTVNAPLYLELLTGYLKSKGLHTRFETEAAISKTEDNRYFVNLADGGSFHTEHVIHAAGSSIKHNPSWQFLPFKTTKGQLLDLTFKSPLPLRESISSMGYFAFLPSTPNRLVVGSTYEHSYDNLQTDDSGREYLYDKLDRTLPGLSDLPHTFVMWSGERVSMKDHKPAIGEHPEKKNFHLFGALGSKGMIHGRYLAKQLANSILNGSPIDSEFNLNRFQNS